MVPMMLYKKNNNKTTTDTKNEHQSHPFFFFFVGRETSELLLCVTHITHTLLTSFFAHLLHFDYLSKLLDVFISPQRQAVTKQHESTSTYQ